MHGDSGYIQRAIDLARDNVEQGGRPFGAVVVRNGQVLATAVNETHLTQDPTAHAELLALQRACRQLETLQLQGAVVYASGQPCPMCLSASLLCGVSRVVFAGSDAEGAPFGLSTAELYQALNEPLNTGKLVVEHYPLSAQIMTLYQQWWATRS